MQSYESSRYDFSTSMPQSRSTPASLAVAALTAPYEQMRKARFDFWGISDNRPHAPPPTSEGLYQLRRELLNPILAWSSKGRLELCKEYLGQSAGGSGGGGLSPEQRRRRLLTPVVKWAPERRYKIYGGLALCICIYGLEGFGVAMLPFAALKQVIHNSPVQWGIGVPAFLATMVPALRKIIPQLDSTMMEWENAAVETAKVVLEVYPVKPSHPVASQEARSPAGNSASDPSDYPGRNSQLKPSFLETEAVLPSPTMEPAMVTSLGSFSAAPSVAPSAVSISEWEPSLLQDIRNLAEEVTTRDAFKVLIRKTMKTQVKVIESVCGILWNLAAGNGLVQNGYVGLISCATACMSIALSILAFSYTRRTIQIYITAQDSSILAAEPEEVTSRGPDEASKRCQPMIAAPILAAIICTLGSVLGAALLFHRSGRAETQADRDIEDREFLAAQLYPSAVSFILVAGHLANLAYALFQWTQLEAQVALDVLQQIWTRGETMGVAVKYANGKLEVESENRDPRDKLHSEVKANLGK